MTACGLSPKRNKLTFKISQAVPLITFLCLNGRELMSLRSSSFIDKEQAEEIRNTVRIHRLQRGNIFVCRLDYDTDMVLLYNMDLVMGLGNLLSPEPLGMKFRKVVMTTIFPFCNLFFVRVFKSIVGFLLDQWPMSTGQGDKSEVRFWREAKKMCSRWECKAVLITGIVNCSPFPMPLSNKCSIRMLCSTGMLVRLVEKL